MQCKDIPDKPVLEFLRDLPDWPDMPGIKWKGTWYWSDDYKPENSVLNAMPEGTVEKLGLAKIRMLMRRGLVGGCSCLLLCKMTKKSRKGTLSASYSLQS